MKKKHSIIVKYGIPAAIISGFVAALTTDIVSVPVDYLRSLFSRPEIGAELHLRVPQNYPAIGGLVVTRTSTGTNIDLFGR